MHDLGPQARRRQPIERLKVAVGVATDRHPSGQLLADQFGVALDLAAYQEEGGRRLPLGEDGQDLGGGVRPGAVIEGERHRKWPSCAGRGVEGDRDDSP